MWSRDAITGLIDRFDRSMTDQKLIGNRLPIANFVARIGSGTVSASIRILIFHFTGNYKRKQKRRQKPKTIAVTYPHSTLGMTEYLYQFVHVVHLDILKGR